VRKGGRARREDRTVIKEIEVAVKSTNKTKEGVRERIERLNHAYDEETTGGKARFRLRQKDGQWSSPTPNQKEGGARGLMTS